MAQASAAQRYEQSQGIAYVVKTGPLAETYKLLDTNTINTGSEISAARIMNKELQQTWLYTANVPFATKRKGKLLLGIGGREAFNAVFGQNTDAVCAELIKDKYIHLNPGQRDLILRLEHSGQVVFVEPNSLDLKGSDDRYSSFPIRTDKYSKDVTVARMPFVNAGYGSGDMLERVMDNLRETGKISETGIHIMNPEHAAENVRDGAIVARASRARGFDGNSWFDADDWVVDSRFGLRGILKNVAEGDASRSVTLEDLTGTGRGINNR